MLHENGTRLVTIPAEFVLVGQDVNLIQDKDGTIMIRPATEEGRLALDRFNPCGDWTDDEWARINAEA